MSYELSFIFMSKKVDTYIDDIRIDDIRINSFINMLINHIIVYVRMNSFTSCTYSFNLIDSIQTH